MTRINGCYINFYENYNRKKPLNIKSNRVKIQ